jgi:hypothetical protein
LFKIKAIFYHARKASLIGVKGKEERGEEIEHGNCDPF